ncbi:MAG TPA: CoA-binding protein [Thermoplasmatales archaeon]|nr:CoA-binding protein [Thermoplasmatales archaeon]
MEKFFNPRSVAVIGASSKKGKIGYEILKNVFESGIEVYPVNPKREEILGRKCYKSLIDIEREIDLAVIAIEAKECIEVIEECGKKEIKNAVIISGGFKESGNNLLEEELREKARKYGIRIIGPNCIGVFNGKNNFNTFFQRNMDLPDFGNVAILTQSGTFGIALLEGFANENIGVSKFVSYGNKADVDEVELINYLEDDRDTKIIAMYVEEIGRKFFEQNFTKPVVILKSGRGKLGQKAAQLHTGAMATNYEIFKGACRQKNVIFADDFEEFFGIIKIIAMLGIPHGNKLSIITNGAGPSVLACDFLENANYIKLSGDVIDLTGSATADDYIDAIEKNDADILLLTFVFQDAPLTESFEKLYEWLKKNSRFYISLALGGKFVEEQRKKLAKLKIPSFEEPRVLINSLNKILEYSMRK